MITIRHTHAEGTLIEGSSKSDGVYDVLKALRDNWRYFPSIRQIGIGQSRDHLASTYKINRAAEALRTAGHEVAVEIDDTERRSFAEAEAERYERAEDRAERMAGYAASAAARSEAAYRQAHQMADAIPFGQPMMPDHYSYGRDRRYRDRIDSTYRRSFAERDKAEHYAHRAENAESYQESRESVPVTLRRIAKLEAEQRQAQRRLDGTDRYYDYGTPASGEYRERLLVLVADRAEQIAYWRGVIEAKQADGVKVWTAADIAKGDFVVIRGRAYEVLRVNAKSVTVPSCMQLIGKTKIISREAAEAAKTPGYPMRTDTYPYDEIRAKATPAELAEYIAAGQIPEPQAAAV